MTVFRCWLVNVLGRRDDYDDDGNDYYSDYSYYHDGNDNDRDVDDDYSLRMLTYQCNGE